MKTQGYYRFPTIHNNTVVFVSDDDLWTISADGGIARRLTSGLGSVSHPALSRDGKWLAFSGRDEGSLEVYVMPAEGGEAQRLTYLDSSAWSQSNLLRGENGIAALTFCEVPIF